MNLTKVYQQYQRYFDILGKHHLIAKNSVMLYLDNASNTIIFGLVLPSWKTATPNYLGGHIHMKALPFATTRGNLQYNLFEAKLCYQFLMQAYFDTALDDLTKVAKDYNNDYIDVGDPHEFAKDFIYILQLYRKFITAFPKNKKYWNEKDDEPWALEILADYKEDGEITNDNYQAVADLGDYYAEYLDMLRPFLFGKDHWEQADINQLISTFNKMRLPNETATPNDHGFADIRIDVLSKKMN